MNTLTASYYVNVSPQEHCFSPCPVTNEGTVTRSWAQFVCYVYNNGKPGQPGLLPMDVRGGQETASDWSILARRRPFNSDIENFTQTHRGVSKIRRG